MLSLRETCTTFRSLFQGIHRNNRRLEDSISFGREFLSLPCGRAKEYRIRNFIQYSFRGVKEWTDDHVLWLSVRNTAFMERMVSAWYCKEFDCLGLPHEVFTLVDEIDRSM